MASPTKAQVRRTKHLKGLDMKKADNKTAYRTWLTWLKKDGLNLGAVHVWNEVSASEDPSYHTIVDQIRGLEKILPVYLEAVLGLCQEELTDDVTPLTWWHAFSDSCLKIGWFEKIFPRLPEELIDYRNHDKDYYLMDNQLWMKMAAVAILRLEVQTPMMLLLLARSDEEFDVMQNEINMDDREEGRRLDVGNQVASHRLTSKDENYSQDASEMEIHKMFDDEQVDTKFTLSVKEARLHQMLMMEAATKVDELYDMDKVIKVIDNHQQLLRQLTHQFEIVQTGHCLLKRDLQAHFASSGSEGRGQESRKDEPVWWSMCNSTVYKLLSKDGMKFESNGVTESDLQKKGRKQRDAIYDRFASPWRMILSYLHKMYFL